MASGEVAAASLLPLSPAVAVTARDTSPLARALRPTRLGARGRAFWTAMTAETMPPADVAVLIVEACHLLDRLDRLSGVVDGDGDDDVWARIRIPRNEGDTEFTLVINGAMAEARQTEQVLRLTLAQIAKATTTPDEQPGGGSGVDELERRRAEREADRLRASAP